MAEPRMTGTPVSATVVTSHVPPPAPVPAPVPVVAAPREADDKPPKSPANRNVRTLVASAFVAIWLILLIVDFFLLPTTDVIPLWFQATGLLVLGYLLGVSMDDIPGRGGSGR